MYSKAQLHDSKQRSEKSIDSFILRVMRPFQVTSFRLGSIFAPKRSEARSPSSSIPQSKGATKMETKNSWNKSIMILAALLLVTSIAIALANSAGSPFTRYVEGDLSNNEEFMVVYATNGKLGFVEIERYESAIRADQLKRKPTEQERRLPVYDKNGIAIGEFVIAQSD